MELRAGTYATPHQKMAIELLRRTGAGYTNIGAWLFKQNLEYGSTEGNDAVEKFTERYNYHLYKSSIELGREKG
jgi:ribonucleotide reductase alpha subunit